jgi:hypothetical protein
MEAAQAVGRSPHRIFSHRSCHSELSHTLLTMVLVLDSNKNVHPIILFQFLPTIDI